MKCLECKFISEPVTIGASEFTSVRCTLGLWDNDNPPGAKRYYSYGNLVRNRGPIRRHGEACKRGEHKGIQMYDPANDHGYGDGTDVG